MLGAERGATGPDVPKLIESTPQKCDDLPVSLMHLQLMKIAPPVGTTGWERPDAVRAGPPFPEYRQPGLSSAHQR